MPNFHICNNRLASCELPPPASDRERVLKLGDPVVIRYLYFFLRHKDRGRQQLMISTFVKTEETKIAAAEAINFYHPRARFDADRCFRLADFGAEQYGHPLCYYTRSYLGETIRLTTKAMELDRADRRVTRALKDGFAAAATVPPFVEHLTWFSLLGAGVEVAERVIDFLNRDDALIESHSLDLHFGTTWGRQLRTGRYLCLPDGDAAEFSESSAWIVGGDNTLRETATGREYTRGSYFVLEIVSQENPAYDKFDAYQNVAELLAMVNRGDRPTEFLEFGAELMRSHRDYRWLDEIETLALQQPPSPDARNRILALYRMLTPRARRLFEPRLKALLGSKPQAEATSTYSN